MSLPIVEYFPAIQGEGDRAGFPSVFIRLGGCNLTCPGFGCKEVSPVDGSEIVGCDSIRAVNKKHFGYLWDKHNASAVVAEVEKMMRDSLGMTNPYSELADIVITGGEPMLHYQNEDLIFILQYFISRGHKVFVETNGTQSVNFNDYPIWKEVSFTISVKMQNSGEQKNHRWKPGVVNNYLTNTKGSVFKFVLDKDLKAVDEIFDFLKMIPMFAPVYIMPQGGNQAELEECAIHVYEWAKRNGFRYSDRLHIRVHNDLAGV